jgi:tetratricopeptide (TPR) repeat protein
MQAVTDMSRVNSDIGAGSTVSLTNQRALAPPRSTSVRARTASRVVSYLTVILALSSMPVVAQQQKQKSLLENVEECNGGARVAAEARINACTAIIDARVGNSEAAAIAYNNRGIARALKGEYDLAIEDYDFALKLNSTYSKAFNNRGIAYQRKADFDRAITDFSEAINIEPEYVNAIVNRAATYEKKGVYELALKDFDEAIRLQPTLGSLWNERCWIRAITGALQLALADCNEAIRLGPKAAARFDSRGFTYLKLGQWESAITDYNSALELRPKMARALYGRGLAKLKVGDVTGGNADIAAAKIANRNIAEEFARYGAP